MASTELQASDPGRVRIHIRPAPHKDIDKLQMFENMTATQIKAGGRITYKKKTIDFVYRYCARAAVCYRGLHDDHVRAILTGLNWDTADDEVYEPLCTKIVGLIVRDLTEQKLGDALVTTKLGNDKSQNVYRCEYRRFATEWNDSNEDIRHNHSAPKTNQAYYLAAGSASTFPHTTAKAVVARIMEKRIAGDRGPVSPAAAFASAALAQAAVRTELGITVTTPSASTSAPPPGAELPGAAPVLPGIANSQLAQLQRDQAQVKRDQAQLATDQAQLTADQAQLATDQAQLATAQAQLASDQFTDTRAAELRDALLAGICAGLNAPPSLLSQHLEQDQAATIEVIATYIRRGASATAQDNQINQWKECAQQWQKHSAALQLYVNGLENQVVTLSQRQTPSTTPTPAAKQTGVPTPPPEITSSPSARPALTKECVQQWQKPAAALQSCVNGLQNHVAPLSQRQTPSTTPTPGAKQTGLPTPPPAITRSTSAHSASTRPAGTAATQPALPIPTPPPNDHLGVLGGHSQSAVAGTGKHARRPPLTQFLAAAKI
ncbi:hypothetical protein Tdes44962_MAKER07219 [Teratosphaeria destructans]|uniref:Uncharacterized protein n=1 Tax=Teratosphaeria destructans TaxID=418781 RepID=A0A9W7T026_9PEZI|nr:hypothetical protein Tdes44962_MAKER07219 [Teratosphaeria destructans]